VAGSHQRRHRARLEFRGARGPVKVVGSDPSLADTVVTEYLDRDLGQTFLATDTLIRSLTVWRPALPDTDGLYIHLFIVGVDSTGVVIADDIVLDGPRVVNFVGDGIHPVPLKFEFDPPFALPHRGEYCFVPLWDFCAAGFSPLTSKQNVYPMEACGDWGAGSHATSRPGLQDSLASGSTSSSRSSSATPARPCGARAGDR
jgi:hypothetical protein